MIKVSEPSVEGGRHLVPLLYRHDPRQGKQAQLRRGGKYPRVWFAYVFPNLAPLPKGQLHLANPVPAPQIIRDSFEEEAEQEEG